jgi:hypothetical protein
MDLGRKLCSYTPWPLKGVQYKSAMRVVRVDQDHGNRSHLKCICDEMDGMVDKEEVWNVSSEYEAEDGSFESTEAETNSKNIEQSETHEAE